jgi:hypothetical protein
MAELAVIDFNKPVQVQRYLGEAGGFGTEVCKARVLANDIKSRTTPVVIAVTDNKTGLEKVCNVTVHGYVRNIGHLENAHEEKEGGQ